MNTGSELHRSIRAARFLAEGRAKRAPFEAIPDEYAPDGAEEAYRVQDALHGILAPDLGDVAGYKIALTTRVMQELVGYGEPIPGAIFASTVHQSPATVTAGGYSHLGVECELAVRLGASLPATGAPYSRESVADNVAAVIPAFELVDDRHADYASIGANILTFIGDNAWNAGVVLGEPVAPWRHLDLAGLHGEMAINGETVGEGDGRDVMGHPLDALAWLANALAARGKALAAGMLVMTGSIIATKFVVPGDEVAFRLGAMEAVRASVR